MSVVHAHLSSAAAPALSCLPDEAPSSPRLRCPPRLSLVSESRVSTSDRPLDCPNFLADIVVDRGEELLQITLPAQELPDRGPIQPHFVRGRLRPSSESTACTPTSSLELRLYRAVSRVRFIDVGVWTLGGYVHWEHERSQDFILLDAVDLCLRAQLPPHGGVATLRRAGALGSAIGAGFSFRP